MVVGDYSSSVGQSIWTIYSMMDGLFFVRTPHFWYEKSGHPELCEVVSISFHDLVSVARTKEMNNMSAPDVGRLL